jgi:hypothetical protein
VRPIRGKVDVYYSNLPIKAALSQPVPPSPERFIHEMSREAFIAFPPVTLGHAAGCCRDGPIAFVLGS